ncbi:tuftelin-interacting protein 11-like [Hylaeus volcanicus]|uniref:tuftelin-interacting protein 11-like n=1 Tax=Hylaeus volcanicus TaxID=313075 RepID=UPI0023B7DDFB|nr:tuftelin-interacting protein 11-like [Hylaeus volcanicus]
MEKLIQVNDLVETASDMQEKRKSAVLKYTPINCTPYESVTSQEQMENENSSDDVLSHASKLLDKSDRICLVIEKIFKKLTDIIIQLRERWPSEYKDFKIHFLGTEIAALLLYCIDSFLMHPKPFQQTLTFYFTSLLIQFRDACVPLESKELRVVWHHIITERILNDIKQTLEHFKITAEKQDTEPLDCVFQWIYAVPLCRVIELLQRHLFPKWLNFLSDWLNCAHVDLERIYNWYTTWKKCFPKSLLNEPLVQTFFISGLELINHYLEKLSENTDMELLENDTTKMDYGVNNNQTNNTHETQQRTNKRKPLPYEIHNSFDSPSHSSTQYIIRNNISEESTTPNVSVKRPSKLSETKVATSDSRFVLASRLVEIIEGLAEDNGILFVPKPARMYNGRQIYGFGKLSIYIDSGVIYKYNGNNSSWSSIPLSALLDHPK